jgi:hypothetical protein
MVVLVGIISHSAADTGYVLVIPLGGFVFAAAGRHPVAGIAAAFAGVSGGFSATFLPSSLDPLLQGFTQSAAQIVDPNRTVNPLCNWYFMAASSLLILAVAWFITDRVVEPRLRSLPVDGKDDNESTLHAFSDTEKLGFWAGIGTFFLLTVLLALAATPQSSPLRAPDGEVRQFTEKAFFEYHLYTLGRRTDLPDNSTKQMELFPTARGVPCQKELVFAPTLDTPWWGHQQFDQNYGMYGNGDVNVFLRFTNDEDSGLGIPLPAGRIRVNQADPADGSLEFIGEDVLDHTPRDEQVLIEMGTAFDVVGERKQTDFKVDYGSHNLWETFEIKLRNHKEEKVEVVVLENLYRAANWKIENPTLPHSKENSNRIRFDVTIPPHGEAVVKYTAHYTW